MTHRRSWRSALEAVAGLGLPARPAEPAESGGAAHTWPGACRESPELLLMRMEALGVDPIQLKASMPTEFRALARVCGYCQTKVRCERDLIYEAAGKAVRWEDYCPNAFRLRAMGIAEVKAAEANSE